MTRRRSQKRAPWPDCPCCGGPARPIGEPQLSLRYETETRSEANERCRFKKSDRKKSQRDVTIEEIAAALGAGQRLPEVGPWYVRLTRIAPGRGLDRDNLARALKAVQDAVAAALGIDDGDEAVRFAHEQTRGLTFGVPGYLGVRVEVWGELGAPGIGWVEPPPGWRYDEVHLAHVPVERLPGCPALVPRWAAELLAAARAPGELLPSDGCLGLRALIDAALLSPDPEERARAFAAALRVSGMSAALTLGGP